ncbi:MAG: hypothetical protein HGA65_12650 [Oscillochloris sp.]|nr:hypothetical protein [Oscillochloris sp.]
MNALARRPWIAGLAVVALFFLLSLLMTWPLVGDLTGSVIGWPGDNFYFAWLVGWFQQALQSGQSPMIAPPFNYPEGWNLAYNEATPAMALLGLPFSLIAGPVFGYNAALLLSFVLSGLGVFLWVRRITGSAAAAIIAGTIFAFAPYRMAHLLGHFNLMGTQWFPFFFLALDDLLAQRARALRHGAMAGLWLGLIALSSQYYLYMTLLIGAAYLLGSLLRDRTAARRSSTWLGLALAALVALPLCALAAWPYVQLSLAGELPVRSFEEVRMWSASPTDLLLPSPRQFIWGPWVDAHFDRRLWIENTLYVGAVTLVLVGLALALRHRAPGGGRVIGLALVALIACVLALGTDLHWMGQPVIVDVPAWLQRLHPYPQTFIPLPGYALLKWLPFYGSMRIWMRYGIFVILFLAAMAGVGAAWLLSRVGPRRAPWVAAALVALVLVDFSQGSLQVASARPRPVDLWLAQATPGPVVQMPIGLSTGPQQMLYALYRRQPFVGGFFAAYVSPQFRRVGPLLQSFPDPTSVATLRELGVRWVIVDLTIQPDSVSLAQTAAGLGMRLATTIEGQQVYELLPRE